MDKQKFVIYLVVAVMAFSVIGLTAVLLIDDGSSSQESAQQVIDDLRDQQEQQAELEAREALAAQNCQPIANPVQENKVVPEAFVPDGDVTELEIVDLKEGGGEAVQPADCVKVYYHGTLASDGTVFDSAFERGEPVRFPLTAVIQGWQQGLVGMKEGGLRRLVIPSELAYGEAGSPPLIQPNADLVFVVELLEIQGQ